ncbi:hypothetical protein NPIL_478001 [Nephila pilipes]|uniref:Uncharacterized protein n=1 Tax=Nephila pilipes TaxID=299642 RepID=A0A8X6PX42_NEPPI|nr:hypothetical protein NPIL_478001 [Nephila pilipes]
MEKKGPRPWLEKDGCGVMYSFDLLQIKTDSRCLHSHFGENRRKIRRLTPQQFVRGCFVCFLDGFQVGRIINKNKESKVFLCGGLSLGAEDHRFVSSTSRFCLWMREFIEMFGGSFATVLSPS